jgi:hypothetical protein
MAYPTLNLTAATSFLDSYIAGEKFEATSAVKVDGVGALETDGIDFCKIADALHKLIDEGPPKSASRAPDAWFEMKAVKILHKPLAKISLQAGSDPKFWVWLTFAACGNRFLELISKRFPGKKGKKPEKVNFGITTQANVFEGLFARIWWRGYRFYDAAAKNPYELAERGYVDLWRSHIIRERYSYGENMARAFIKFMYPTHGVVSGHHVGLMRALPPKLKARHTSCCFESLSEEECTKIIQELAAEAAAEGFPVKTKSTAKSTSKGRKKPKKSRKRK